MTDFFDLLAEIDFIGEFAEHLEDLGRATSTIELYVETLRRMHRELPEGLYAADDSELKRWLRGPKDRPWSKSTKHQRRSIASTFFAFACNPNRPLHLDYNPTLYLPQVSVPPRHPRPAADDVIEDALERTQGLNQLSFLIAAYAGARCIELAALDREDVTEQNMLLHGKGDKARLVPTHPRIWEAVRRLPPGPILRDEHGKRLSRRQVSRRGNRALHRLGHTRITMHMFRHSFGTAANDVVGDIMVVRDLLGHASVATSQIYVATSRRQMVAAVHGLYQPAA